MRMGPSRGSVSRTELNQERILEEQEGAEPLTSLPALSASEFLRVLSMLT